MVAGDRLTLRGVERGAVVAGDRELAAVDRDPVGVASQVGPDRQPAIAALLDVGTGGTA